MKIGILGVDPETTSNFFRDLVNLFVTKDIVRKNQDWPQFVINNIPGPAMFAAKINDSDLVPYLNGMVELDKVGVDCSVMVCNTFYLYKEKFQEKIKTPILDLRKAVKSEINKRNIKSVVAIGTPSTMMGKLYQYSDLNNIESSDDEIDMLAGMINDYTKNINREVEIEKLTKYCQSNLDKGADAIILGCTEFGEMMRGTKLPVIDSYSVLLNLVLNYYLSENRGPNL